MGRYHLLVEGGGEDMLFVAESEYCWTHEGGGGRGAGSEFWTRAGASTSGHTRGGGGGE